MQLELPVHTYNPLYDLVVLYVSTLAMLNPHQYFFSFVIKYSALLPTLSWSDHPSEASLRRLGWLFYFALLKIWKLRYTLYGDCWNLLLTAVAACFITDLWVSCKQSSPHKQSDTFHEKLMPSRLRDIFRGWGPAVLQNIHKQDSWSVLGCVQPRSPDSCNSCAWRKRNHFFVAESWEILNKTVLLEMWVPHKPHSHLIWELDDKLSTTWWFSNYCKLIFVHDLNLKLNDAAIL